MKQAAKPWKEEEGQRRWRREDEKVMMVSGKERGEQRTHTDAQRGTRAGGARGVVRVIIAIRH